jgi:hypothetical protein
MASTAANTETTSCPENEGRKVGFLTVEERRAKVLRYLEKKKRRRSGKIIKYKRR